MNLTSFLFELDLFQHLLWMTVTFNQRIRFEKNQYFEDFGTIIPPIILFSKVCHEWCIRAFDKIPIKPNDVRKCARFPIIFKVDCQYGRGKGNGLISLERSSDHKHTQSRYTQHQGWANRGIYQGYSTSNFHRFSISCFNTKGASR